MVKGQYLAQRHNGISREEFAEIRSQVASLAHDIEGLTLGFKTEQKERDLRLNSEISKLESEMRNRFEKNEELASNKNTSDVEGRRWLIGTIAGLVIVLGAMINWWGSSIKESTLGDVNNSLNLIREQNAVSIKDRDDIRRITDEVSKQVNITTTGLAAMESKVETQLTEVETQFRASDRARNVQFAQQQRENLNTQNELANLGAKVQVAPNAPFYFPEVTHDGNVGSGNK